LKVIGKHVSIQTGRGRAGIRELDLLVEDSAGKLFAIEVKSGSSVRTASQIAKDRIIATEGGTIVGKNAPEQLKGTHRIIDTIEITVAR
jgi:hypothetical protein